MHRIDDFLIDRIFDPFAKKFQVVTGKSCYFLAQMCFWFCSSICVITAIVSYLLGLFTLVESIPIVVVSFLNSLLFLKCIDCMKRLQKKLEDKPSNAIYPSRLEYQFFRLGCVFLVQYNTVMLSILWNNKAGFILFSSLSVTLLGFVLALYFFACTPLPPGRSKIGEWADNFRAFFAKTQTHNSHC